MKLARLHQALQEHERPFAPHKPLCFTCGQVLARCICHDIALERIAIRAQQPTEGTDA